MVLDGSIDPVKGPPAGAGELDPAAVDHLEFYLLNYFKPAVGDQTLEVASGRSLLDRVGCTRCHVADLQIDRDRRVADVNTAFDPVRGGLNRLFATAFPRYVESQDVAGLPSLKQPQLGSFVVASS